MAMEVVILFEFETGAASGRAALLEKVGALALAGQARLSFVGTESSGSHQSGCDVVAIGLARASAAAGLLERWRGEGILAATTKTRILQVQPLWSMEPLALMFP
jgi:hypothetical protein